MNRHFGNHHLKPPPFLLVTGVAHFTSIVVNIYVCTTERYGSFSFSCRLTISEPKGGGPVGYDTSAMYLVLEGRDRVFHSHYTVGVLVLEETRDRSLASEGRAEGLGDEGSGVCV